MNIVYQHRLRGRGNELKGKGGTTQKFHYFGGQEFVGGANRSGAGQGGKDQNRHVGKRSGRHPGFIWVEGCKSVRSLKEGVRTDE